MINSNLNTQEELLQKRLLARSKSKSKNKNEPARSPFKSQLNLEWSISQKIQLIFSSSHLSEWYFF